MTKKTLVTGPTFEEMLHPEKIDPKVRKAARKARDEDPLDRRCLAAPTYELRGDAACPVNARA